MKKYLLPILLLAFSVSCSTRKRILYPSSPEVGVQQTESPYGYFNFAEEEVKNGSSFTAFLWPNDSATPLATIVDKVTRESRQIDVLAKQFRSDEKRLIREQELLVQVCEKETVKPEPTSELRDCDKMVKEKKVKEACVCLTNNQPLLAGLTEKNIQSRLDGIKRILTLVEPPHWLLGGSLAAYRSSVKISPEGVSIRLMSFQRPDMIYKTNSDQSEGRIDNAKYDVRKKILSFRVLEKDEAGVETGNTFEFVMERGRAAEGPTEITRFKGDVIMKNKEGKVVRIGTAKFDGEWSAEQADN